MSDKRTYQDRKEYFRKYYGTEDWRQYQQRYRLARLADIRRIKSERGCADCGERNHVVLQFAHRDPSTKVTEVGKMSRFPWTVILAEIEKCDVLCANCHLIRDYRRNQLPPDER